MLKKEFEEDDPYSFVGVGFPCPEGSDSMGEMARCFVEEYAMLGYPKGFVLKMFRTPMYQGPHGVFLVRGEQYVVDLVNEVFGEFQNSEVAHA